MHMTTYDSHTVVANNETAAMLVYEINPVRVQLFSCVNTFFWSNKFIAAGHVTAYAL